MTIANLNGYLTIPASSGTATPTGPAGGDLSGTYPNPTVAAVNGAVLGTTATTAGTALIGTGTAIASVALSGDATINGTGVVTLKNTGPGATGPIGSTTVTPVITIDAQGRVTALTSATISTVAASALDGTFAVKNTADNTKQFNWTLANQATGTTVTWNTGAQTASRTVSLPVLAGNDTLVTLTSSPTFTGTVQTSNLTVTGGLLAQQNSGFRNNGAAGSYAAVSGSVNMYRISGTIGNAGSIVLQADPGQSTGTIICAGGTSPANYAVFGGTAATVGVIGSTWTGCVLAGVQTSLAAVAGQVGEVLTGTPQTTYANFTTTATYQNLVGVLALTAGDWLITATMTFSSNGATLGNSAEMGLSSTTGTLAGSSPLNTEGLSIAYIPVGLFTTLSVFQTETVNIRYQVSSATNVYFVGKASFSVGNPQYTASLTATRMR